MPINANGAKKEFGPGDATVSAFGKEVDGFKKVTYTSEQEATKNYAGNNRLNSYSLGKVEEEFSIELYMSQMREWETIAKAATGQAFIPSLPPFPIAMTYLNEMFDEVTDIAVIKVTGVGRSIDGGSDGMAHELKCLCLGIQYDV